MANINNIINVSLLAGGQLVARDNMNVCAIMTSDQSFLTTKKRYSVYKDAPSVAADFGSGSAAYDHALTFFGQSPNPANVGGALVMGYWRATDEVVAATNAVLTGAQLSEAAIMGAVQSIEDGDLSLTIDGVAVDLSLLDFRTTETLDEVAAVLNTAIANASVVVVDQRFIITSLTDGLDSTISLASSVDADGSPLGSILGLASGTGATIEQGVETVTLFTETKDNALIELKKLVNFKGAVFIDNPTDDESLNIAAWCKANAVIFYDVFDNTANLERDVTNIVWQLKLSAQTNYRCLYSVTGQRKMATAYMARAHTVNFSGERTTLTMHLKTLVGVIPEPHDQTAITKAQSVGLDVYANIKGVPATLTSGVNDYVDNVYNLIAYIDAVQTDAYNLLKATSTKIPQTTRGVNQLVATVEKTTRGFVRAEAFAAGTWSSPDGFGDIDVLKRSVLANGFYILAGLLSAQVQSEREQRKSPVIQTAVKNAGAIHYADIIINFNK